VACRIPTAPNFWKKIPENRAGQQHISQAGKVGYAGTPTTDQRQAPDD
jgi:hypothetical protein